MLETILAHLHNWFPARDGVRCGAFRIVSGALEDVALKPGQYYRIKGSIFNDGLHRMGDEKDVLTDENFIGEVWALAIPKAVINLSEKIAKWEAENPVTDKVSESFGGYSYSRGGAGTQSADTGGWQTAFRKELNQWKKVSD